MADIFDLYRRVFGQGEPQQGPPQEYSVGADTIPLSLDRTPVGDPYTGTALYQLMGKLGDIGTAVPGLAERAQLGAMNALGMRQADGDIYRSKLPVAPGIEALGDAATFATGGLASGLAPAAGAYREAARYGARAAMPVARDLLADEFGGIRAFHGSPHNFDRFDLSKIGTGEGAQAYGHGLYFAENEGVARGYRDQLSNFTANGKPLSKALSMELGAYGGDVSKLLDFRRNQLERWSGVEDTRGIVPSLQKDIKELEGLQRATIAPSGHMYEVDINADPKSFLDWDKPLREQPDILERLQSQTALRTPLYMGERSGQEIYQSLLQGARPTTLSEIAKAGPDARAIVPETLKELGIPGTRYLDQGSRVVPGQVSINRRIMNDPNVSQAMRDQAKADLAKWESENTTSNYAIFDPEIIEIRRKYGLLPPLAAGGGLLATQQEQQ